MTSQQTAQGSQAGPGNSNRQAIKTIEEAFETFRSRVTTNDAQQFHDTTLRDVWSAAKEVERKLAAKQSSRNLKRIQPFLEGLEHYSKAVEVLCNGTPYLPWIWAPIKLCLIVASDHITAFEKLIQAYAQIAEALPRFDRLGQALRERSDFQNVLVLVYCDIIEFHHRAYRMFNFPAWKRFFDTSWKRFDLHFAAVLESLRSHTDLADKEANAYGIESTMKSATVIHEIRQKIYENATARADEKRDREFEALLAWLDVHCYSHEDDFTRLKVKSVEGTCEWLHKHKLVRRWITTPAGNSKDSKLWIHGKPGSGKSVLSASLIENLLAANSHSVVYYIFTYQSGSRNDASTFLRSVARQLLSRKPDLAGNVYDEYVRRGASPSMSALKSLIGRLVASLPPTRIVVDGVDECSDQQQRDLLKAATGLTEDHPIGCDCKTVIFSRDVDIIHKHLAKYPQISLSAERGALDQAIALFVRTQISVLRQEQDDLKAPESEYAALEQQVTSKADVMLT